MSRRQDAVVAIPVYRDRLLPCEALSVARCLDVLGQHPLRVVAPEGLAVPAPLDRFPAERFSPSFFSGIEAYSALMLSPGFYRRFLAYEYMLIHRLDSFVFRDELSDWCAKGYDYIGAPWVGEDWPNLAKTRQGLPFWTRSRLFRFLPHVRYDVGNGGFSLRKVSSMYRATRWLRRTRQAWGGRNEDGFFGIAVPECWWWTGYRIPPAAEAMRFAVETRPADCFAQMGGQLPFGCHGWDKIEPAFWHSHLAALGYNFDLQAAGRLEAERLARRRAKQEARRHEGEGKTHVCA